VSTVTPAHAFVPPLILYDSGQPRLVAELARMRDGVKAPAQRPVLMS
jgi:hypothetical protein